MNPSRFRRAAMVPLVWACVIVLFASLPYLVGVWLTPRDGVFTGFTYNIDDACVYSSWIRQVADGHILFRNLYTSEPQRALQFNILFLILGWIARITHLSPAAVLHLARVLLGIGLLMLVWKFSERFLKSPAERALVIPMVGLTSGLGWILPKIAGHMGPVDLWQPEAITFLSIYLNPLFLAGMVLMLAAFHFLYRMKGTGSWRDVLLAGLMLLMLANVHTYDVLTVGAVWAVYLAAKSVQMRRFPSRLLAQSAAAAVIALPAIAYQFYLYSSESAFRMRVESAAPSPALWAYFAGYGLVLVLAVIGGWIALKEKRGALILVVWAVVGFALPYVPVAQQRKLVMGLHFPLAILSVIALATLAKRVGRVDMALLIAVALAVLIPSNIMFSNRDIAMLQKGITAPFYPAYLSNSELAALRWLRNNTKPDDTVLASRELALFVPTVAGNQVYYGHWSETPDFKTKLTEWIMFINADTPDVFRKEYLARTGARYIVYPSRPEDQSISFGSGDSMSLFNLRAAPYAKVVFESGDTAVYEVR